MQTFLLQKHFKNYSIIVGVIHGILGIILIYFGFEVYKNNILDLRQLAILSAAYFGGIRATLVTGILLICFRLSINGINEGSITACISITINVIASGLISKFIHKYWLKWFSMILFLIILSCSLMIYQNIIYSHTIFPILPLYDSFIIGGGSVIAAFILFLKKSNELKNALKESEERYRTLIETSPDGIFVQIGGFIQLANNKAANLLGAKHPSDLIGIYVFDLIDTSYREDSLNRFEQFIHGSKKSDQKESKYIRLDGRSIDLAFSGSKVNFEGKPATMVVFRDISEQKKAEQKLQQANQLLHKLSMSDGLTGIANRRYFEEIYTIRWDEAILSQKPLSIMLIDIDSFKKFNDTYGHIEGDNCLQVVANAISMNLHRESDFSARYGGEEFIGILSDTSEKKVIEIAERIRESIFELKIPNINSLTELYVTVSIGVATFIPNDSMERKEAIDAADKALYTAKITGRNKVFVFNKVDNEYLQKQQ
ncbi:diguanylate cyclase [Bacillus sp. EAC]|uniref:diguanylate cyclase n=1 Tax=Bacillus sp. EAC TaxID=1978338 RepID=UPI00211B35AE|nr:diguanylate cyclase [Bacillus sp. EAC]